MIRDAAVDIPHLIMNTLTCKSKPTNKTIEKLGAAKKNTYFVEPSWGQDIARRKHNKQGYHVDRRLIGE